MFDGVFVKTERGLLYLTKDMVPFVKYPYIFELYKKIDEAVAAEYPEGILRTPEDMTQLRLKFEHLWRAAFQMGDFPFEYEELTLEGFFSFFIVDEQLGCSLLGWLLTNDLEEAEEAEENPYIKLEEDDRSLEQGIIEFSSVVMSAFGACAEYVLTKHSFNQVRKLVQFYGEQQQKAAEEAEEKDARETINVPAPAVTSEEQQEYQDKLEKIKALKRKAATNGHGRQE